MRIREWVHRLLGTVAGRRRDRDLEEELRAHLELAAEAERGRIEPTDDALRGVRLRAGGVAQAMEALRDQRGLPWLEALGSDVVFGSRQLRKQPTVTVAAILSLGLSVGSTTAAFQLIDAVLVRRLPVAEPGRLYSLAWNATTSRNEADYRESFDYPSFRRYSDVTAGKARLMVVGIAAPLQVIVANGTETELVHRQYFSGNVFPTFGHQPALGRLLTPDDDRTPGAHPVVVITLASTLGHAVSEVRSGARVTSLGALDARVRPPDDPRTTARNSVSLLRRGRSPVGRSRPLRCAQLRGGPTAP